MSKHLHIFGYIFVGGSPSETSFVSESLAYNAHVIAEIRDLPWHSDDFRIQQTDDLRASQTIAVAKFSTARDQLALMDALIDILKRMHWSDGYVVNRSIDRSMCGLPLTYEYDFDVADYSVANIQPVGESLHWNRIER